MGLFYGMVPLVLLILAYRATVFYNARPGEEGQATSPLESFVDSPQLSVSRNSKSIAQNTPALRAILIPPFKPFSKTA